MSKHKIEDCTAVLYNIMFVDMEADNKCHTSMCKTGKCICMDNEQAGLLRKLLSEDDQIAVSLTDGRFFFQNMQSRLFTEGICGQAPVIKSIYCDVLYRDRYFPKYEEILCQMIETYRDFNHVLMNVIKSIPIIYAINSLHKMKERDSLIYLCMYSPCTESYRSILLRAIICRTIGCCQRAKDQEEKEKYVSELAKLLNRLDALLGQDNMKIVNIWINGIEKYIDMWKKMDSGKSKADALNISYELQEYREELEGYEGARTVGNDDGRHNKLYCILKKILETADLSIAALPDLPFADYEDEKTDYDKVINILERVKDDAGKLAEVWSILSQIFWRGEDIPTEEIEHMERIAKENV